MSLVDLIISKKKYYTTQSGSFKIIFKWWTLEIIHVVQNDKINIHIVLKAFCFCCNSPEVGRVYTSSLLNRLKGRPIKVSWFVQLVGALGKESRVLKLTVLVVLHSSCSLEIA